MEKLIKELTTKFKYDKKTLNVIKKIIPHIINYYGEDNKEMLFSVLKDIQIIPCNSRQTVRSFINEPGYIKTPHFLENINSEGEYISKIKIKYDKNYNKFYIDELKREIVISHTYNFDSPKGIEILTYQICKAIKSYKKEYEIKENILTKRQGLNLETYKIISDQTITLQPVLNQGAAINEGFNIYDTEQIVSNILNDEYKIYKYESIKKVAIVLKKKYQLKGIITKSEIIGNIDLFKNAYNIKNNAYDPLINLCDSCLELEKEMLIFASSREKKDEIKNQLNKILENGIFTNLIEYKKEEINSN